MLASSLYSICFAVLLQGEVLCVDPSKIIYRLKNREGNWMAPMANFFNFFKAHFAEKSLSLSLSLSLQDALPPKEMDPAEKHCRMADVVLCLGTR
jgi:hypothetical protein